MLEITSGVQVFLEMYWMFKTLDHFIWQLAIEVSTKKKDRFLKNSGIYFVATKLEGGERG